MTDRFKSILLWIAKIGLFIVPFIPLYVSQAMFFPFITGKAVVFRIIVELVFALWLTLAIFYKEFRPKKTPLLWALGAFIIILAAAAVFGANPYRSFWSNFERMEGLVTHLHLFAYFLVLGHVFKKSDWIIFFNFFVFSGIMQNFYALSQKLGYVRSLQSGFRVDGTIGNATYVAAYSLFVAFLALFLFLRETTNRLRLVAGASLLAYLIFAIHELSASGLKLGQFLNSNPVFIFGFLFFLAACIASFTIREQSKFWKYFYSGGFIFTLLTIYFTATRGAVLALFVGGIILALIYIFTAKPKDQKEIIYKKVVIAALILTIVFAGGIKIFRNSQFVKNSEILSRLASISLKEGKSRFLIWNMGWEGFKDKPILGWGQDNYNLVFAKYYNPKLFTQEPWFDRSHNIILDWLISAGLLGLLSYLSILVTAIYVIWRLYGQSKKDPERDFRLPIAAFFTLLFFVYLMQNLFVFDQLATYLSFFAVLAYLDTSWSAGLAAARKSENKENKLSGFRIDSSVKFLTLGVILAITVFIGYHTVFKPLSANITLIKAMQAGSAGQTEKSFAFFEKAFAYRTFGHQEISEQFAQFTITIVKANNVSPELKEEIFKKAISELGSNVKANPYDPRVHLFLGAVYRAGGLFDEALLSFEEAIRLAPAKQQIYFELADTYLSKNDYSAAVKTLEPAFELEPDFDEARINLAALYILNGEQDKADQLLIQGYGKIEVAENILAQVYSKIGNQERLLGIWTAFTESDPGNIQYWKNVAATYLILGNKNSAIKILEEAVKANPEFSEEAQLYIDEIKSGKL